jgi:hypothetical protein
MSVPAPSIWPQQLSKAASCWPKRCAKGCQNPYARSAETNVLEMLVVTMPAVLRCSFDTASTRSPLHRI